MKIIYKVVFHVNYYFLFKNERLPSEMANLPKGDIRLKVLILNFNLMTQALLAKQNIGTYLSFTECFGVGVVKNVGGGRPTYITFLYENCPDVTPDLYQIFTF